MSLKVESAAINGMSSFFFHPYSISFSKLQLDHTNKLSSSLYYYITVATRVIMTAVIREAFAGDLAEDRVRKNTKIPRKETRYGSLTSYMGIAIGLFSRLSLDIDVPVDEVTELGKLGRQIMKCQ